MTVTQMHCGYGNKELETKMKMFAKALIVTAGMTTTTIAPMQAHAGISSLEECYTAVINWCNETFPNHDCSNTSGLDDCDEEFGDTTAGMSPNRLFIQHMSDGTYRLRFEAIEPPRFVLGDGEDDDDRERRPIRKIGL